MISDIIYITKFYLQKFASLHHIIHLIRLVTKKNYRNKYKEDISNIKKWHINNGELLVDKTNKKHAVLFGWASFDYALSESLIRLSLNKAGFSSVVYTAPIPIAKFIYSKFGLQISSFNKFMPFPSYIKARKIVKSFKNSEDLIKYKFDGVAVGKYACSSFMRHTRSGRINLKNNKQSQIISRYLAISISSAIAAKKMIEKTNPEKVIVIDRGYTPFGEVFDICINNSIDIITWNIAHKDNTIMLKRYNKGNKISHPSSLSSKTWSKLANMNWNNQISNNVLEELEYCYSSGEWYSEVGTQFNKIQQTESELSEKIGLDLDKKTAVIYAHIFWDATFFWGEDIFKDYEEWFIETVKSACSNKNLNWIIKVHPANLVKNYRDGIQDEPSEISSLKNNIGQLPNHVKLISADSDISTWSLFNVMDYCLTVRGTVGIEAAMLGKTVLTAGTGRYDNHGFTLDFKNRDEFLKALQNLHNLKKPSNSQELALKYATGIFIDRPLNVRSFDISHKKDNYASLRSKLLVKDFRDLHNAKDISSVASWLISNDEDFLN